MRKGCSDSERVFFDSRAQAGAPGFSLIELLTVVGVIVVLLGLLVPFLQKARDWSNVTGCQANLRQIGICVQFYIQDHDGQIVPMQCYASPGDESSSDRTPWSASLQAYFSSIKLEGRSTASSIFYCPSFVRSGALRVQNGFPTSYVVNRSVMADLTEKDRSVSLAAITSPATTLLMADGFSYDKGGVASIRNVSHVIPGSGCRIDYDWHGGDSANFLFLDGHVEKIAEKNASTSFSHQSDTVLY